MAFILVKQQERLAIVVFSLTSGRDVGLLIQDVEPNGRIHRDGRLRVGDHIVAINGISLISTDFYRYRPVAPLPLLSM